MISTEKLLHVADVLEKAAEYIDNQEKTKVAEEQAVARERAEKLAGQVADAIGEPVTEELIEKLSGVDGNLGGLLGRLSGGEAVDSMGGPQETKTASIAQGMGPAEQGLLSWLNT